MTVALLDYGINNLRSIANALRDLGAEVEIQKEFSPRDKLVIPGVGAFGAAMAELAPSIEAIRRYADDGGEVLGICLGQQLLFERSEEHGATAGGLGLIAGDVTYLPRDEGVKVPHIGWTPVKFAPGSRLGNGLADDVHLYFVHSLRCMPSDDAVTTGVAEHGVPFAAVVEAGNVSGVQFHPEKSGEAGHRLLENFLK